MKTYLRMTIVLGVLFATFASRNAHAQLPNGYGTGIPVETARKVAAAAIAEAKKNGWNVAAAIVDTGGDLVFFERMDNAQVASAIGVSGATSPQDGQCALAAAETLGKQPTLPTPPKPPTPATPPAATPPKK